MNFEEIVQSVLRFIYTNMFVFADILMLIAFLSAIVNCGQLGGMFFINGIIIIAISFIISYFIITPIINVYLELHHETSIWSISLIIIVNTLICWFILSQLFYGKVKRVIFADFLLGVVFGIMMSLLVFYITYISLKFIVNQNKVPLPNYVYTFYRESASSKTQSDDKNIEKLRTTVLFKVARFFETSFINHLTGYIFESIKNNFNNQKNIAYWMIVKQKDISEFWRDKLISSNRQDDQGDQIV